MGGPANGIALALYISFYMVELSSWKIGYVKIKRK